MFVFDSPALAIRTRRVLSRLPALEGKPIRIERRAGLRDVRGAVHAGAFLRERKIAFDCASHEFGRIFVHELFHFAWLRLGNPRRRSYEEILRVEIAAKARGELGWSAEWRKRELGHEDLRRRTGLWREYCCESFCDSAAWMYSGVGRHEEFTLAGRFRARRRAWFLELAGAQELSI